MFWRRRNDGWGLWTRIGKNNSSGELPSSAKNGTSRWYRFGNVVMLNIFGAFEVEPQGYVCDIPLTPYSSVQGIISSIDGTCVRNLDHDGSGHLMVQNHGMANNWYRANIVYICRDDV